MPRNTSLEQGLHRLQDGLRHDVAVDLSKRLESLAAYPGTPNGLPSVCDLIRESLGFTEGLPTRLPDNPPMSSFNLA
ncbi:MAG: hypothetical protein IPK44_25485 [Candidatus Accumulibacter sp.]|uniref:hypothetical protein n=1 Tax=Accumulibacter sp. TaxID=2053492 RepID=UPI00258EFC0E|nr:hypothetical protein [Accumulibacter sp.]MBK8117642.1 hypothetical protein [Accumulibacter sp.]